MGINEKRPPIGQLKTVLINKQILPTGRVEFVETRRENLYQLTWEKNKSLSLVLIQQAKLETSVCTDKLNFFRILAIRKSFWVEHEYM